MFKSGGSKGQMTLEDFQVAAAESFLQKVNIIIIIINYYLIKVQKIKIQSCLVCPHTLVPTCFGRINEACRLLDHPIIAHILTICNYMYMCIWVLWVYISRQIWIVYVHKHEYYIKIMKNKEIGLKCDAILKVYIHTRWRFAGGRRIANGRNELAFAVDLCHA